MLPEDFALRSRYGVGRDWPLDYADLEPYYRQAEYEIGVAADVADQAHLGVEFAPGYDYPMQRIPPSYSDQVLADVGRRHGGHGRRRPHRGQGPQLPRGAQLDAARNDYRPVGAVDVRPDGQALGRDLGQRCAGNTACTPICPIQAKYNAGKTLAQADPSKLEVIAQAVAQQDPRRPGQRPGQRRRVPALRRPRLAAAHGPPGAGARVRAGGPRGRERQARCWPPDWAADSGMLGRNLMDHPSIYGWGLAPAPVGPFRGPLSTSGIDDVRGGAFRAAARRVPGRHRQRRLASDHRRTRHHGRRGRDEPGSLRRGAARPPADGAVAPGALLAGRRAAAVARTTG